MFDKISILATSHSVLPENCLKNNTPNNTPFLKSLNWGINNTPNNTPAATLLVFVQRGGKKPTLDTEFASALTSQSNPTSPTQAFKAGITKKLTTPFKQVSIIVEARQRNSFYVKHVYRVYVCVCMCMYVFHHLW